MKNKIMEYMSFTNFAYLLIFGGGVGAILLAIIQAKGATEDKNEIISKHEKKITELDSALKEKIKFIESYISGGDSYPELEILSIPNSSQQIEKMFFQISNHFDMPNYDLKIEMYDYDFVKLKSFIGKDNIKYINPSDFTKARILNFQEANLPPKTTKAGFYSSKAKDSNFYAKLFTRNKLIIQKIIVMNHKGNYYLAWELIDDTTDQTLKRFYSSDISTEIKKKLDIRLKNITNKMELKFSE